MPFSNSLLDVEALKVDSFSSSIVFNYKKQAYQNNLVQNAKTKNGKLFLRKLKQKIQYLILELPTSVIDGRLAWKCGISVDCYDVSKQFVYGTPEYFNCFWDHQRGWTEFRILNYKVFRMLLRQVEVVYFCKTITRYIMAIAIAHLIFFVRSVSFILSKQT